MYLRTCGGRTRRGPRSAPADPAPGRGRAVTAARRARAPIFFVFHARGGCLPQWQCRPRWQNDARCHMPQKETLGSTPSIRVLTCVDTRQRCGAPHIPLIRTPHAPVTVLRRQSQYGFTLRLRLSTRGGDHCALTAAALTELTRPWGRGMRR